MSGQLPTRDVEAPVLAPESPVPILLVDDNASKRLALKAVLAPLGYSIVEADSGVAALRCVTIQEFAVILLDVRMPVMSGVETATLIRQRRQSEMTPIIFITAHGSDEIMHTDRYAQGAVDFIFAPVQPDELRAKVSVFANLFRRAEALAARAHELQTSADQLRLLTEAAPIGIFQTDSEHRYVYTNPRWSEITGIPAEEAAGQDWGAVIGAETRAGLIAELAEGELYRGELSDRFEIQVPGAPTRIVLVTSKSIPDNRGGVAGWVGTLADITAEAGAEAAMSAARDEANEASRLKSDFLANMSHEIRTPMNGVIGMTDLLLETELDTRQRDYAQTARNSGEALLTIIDTILDFSKVEAGRLEVEHVEFSLRTVVDDVVDLLAGSAQAKGLELVTVVERPVPALVTGDPGRVRQVVTNLIGNAVKFTETGEVVLRVTLAGTVGTDAILRFDVSDTGTGIAPDKLESIFQPFVQADTSTSRKHGGTGLGLAISAQLVALMGGECGVTSRPGEGSNFWFTIRVRAETATGGQSIEPPDAGLDGVSVLIVDDNATLRHVLAEKMTAWGMAVDTAGSGATALTTLRTAATEGRPFALVLLDHSLPGVDGLHLRDALAADPSLDPRVVLMTNLGQEDTAGNSPESGVSGTLSKPIHRQALRAALQAALGLRNVATPPAGPARRPAPDGGRKLGRLLLAEDNLVNQKVAVAMLTSAGYRVDTVLNGAAAVRAVAAQSYDAILMDCQMPELNGYEATAAIRTHEGRGRHTPIIAMTAGARREDRERCLAEGMDSYLAKPVSKDALLALVARSISDAANGVLPAKPAMDAPSPPVLDPQIIDRLERLGDATGEDLMGQLTELFLSDAGLRVAELHDALAAGDASGASEAAHTLSGAAGNLGATGLAALCATMALETTALETTALETTALETTATNGAPGRLAQAEALLGAIEAELARVRSALASPALA